jgi:hypothetical protein
VEVRIASKKNRDIMERFYIMAKYSGSIVQARLVLHSGSLVKLSSSLLPLPLPLPLKLKLPDQRLRDMNWSSRGLGVQLVPIISEDSSWIVACLQYR